MLVDYLTPGLNKAFPVLLLVKPAISKKGAGQQGLPVDFLDSLRKILLQLGPSNFFLLKTLQQILALCYFIIDFINLSLKLIILLSQLGILVFILLKIQLNFIQLLLVGNLLVLKHQSLVFK